MYRNPISLRLSSRPDLLDIDSEFAVNLKVLLDGSGLKNDRGSDIDSTASSSTASSRENFAIPPLRSIPSDAAAAFRHSHELKSVPEENCYSIDTIFTNPVNQNRRTFHTTFFQGSNGKAQGSVDLGGPMVVPTPSKPTVKRNMSARIQSLLENFESSTSSSIPEIPRGIEKRPAKYSPEVSMPENKVLFPKKHLIFLVSPEN